MFKFSNSKTRCRFLLIHSQCKGFISTNHEIIQIHNLHLYKLPIKKGADIIQHIRFSLASRFVTAHCLWLGPTVHSQKNCSEILRIKKLRYIPHKPLIRQTGLGVPAAVLSLVVDWNMSATDLRASACPEFSLYLLISDDTKSFCCW